MSRNTWTSRFEIATQLSRSDSHDLVNARADHSGQRRAVLETGWCIFYTRRRGRKIVRLLGHSTPFDAAKNSGHLTLAANLATIKAERGAISLVLRILKP
jgi:hypothetical protein